MNICSYKHDEIVHEGNICPICGLLDDKDIRIEELETEVAELKGG